MLEQSKHRVGDIVMVSTRQRETANEFGTLVVEYKCSACGATFTVCPAPDDDNDAAWENCLAPTCASYDPSRDVDKWFDEGRVRAIGTEKGFRLVPFKSIDGGKS